VPHPIPYQGSKRRLAGQILARMPRAGGRLVEPFAGSAAITLAAAARHAYGGYLIADGLPALAGIWEMILSDPERLANGYERLWTRQLDDPRRTYECVRNEFNRTGDPVLFLYLVARCVKGSVRFNRDGDFNQGPDNRRLGMRPDVMRREITGAHTLLRGRANVRAADFRETLAEVTEEDVVYMDPPYEGISDGRDRRYFSGISRQELVVELERLNARGVPFLLSYDGSCGDRSYGGELPGELRLVKIALVAGRSTQSTLAGRAEITVESLYISPAAEGLRITGEAVARGVEQMRLEV
jgi:DNA adenine methylase